MRALRFTTDKPWKECLPLACFSYNVSVQDSTGYPPYMLVFSKNKDIVQKTSRDVNNIAGVRQSARTHAFQKRKERVDTVNEKRQDQAICVGDMVYVRSNEPGKLVPRVHEEKAKVTRIVSKNVIELSTDTGFTFRRSRKDILKDGCGEE